MTKVVITFNTQGPGSDGERLSQEYFGEYYQRGDYHYVIYRTKDEESKAEIKTLLKYKEDYLKVTRTGQLNHQQEFKLGLCGKSKYRTPYGTLDMSHDTKRITVKKDGHTKIKVIYDLYINDVEQGAMEIDIKIAPVH